MSRRIRGRQYRYEGMGKYGVVEQIVEIEVNWLVDRFGYLLPYTGNEPRLQFAVKGHLLSRTLLP